MLDPEPQPKLQGGPLWQKAMTELMAGTSKQRQRIPTVWVPQEGPQEYLIKKAKDSFEVFYGGARGGGKTDGMLGDFLINQVMPYGSGARGVFFRRRAIRLEDVIRRSQEIYLRTGASWNGSTKTWTWPSGATLRFRHLWDLKESEDYKTYAFTWMCFEQVEEWPDPQPIDRLRGAARSAEGVPVRIRLTGNPGGIGHAWVKARYIDPRPQGMEPVVDELTNQERLFIPAKLEDNPILRKGDPDYENRLLTAGSEQLVKGWRHGSWDIVAGGFFSHVWDPDIDAGLQLLHPITIPDTWWFARSFDWGHSKPSSLGLWAVSDGTPLPANDPHYPNKLFPPGSYIRIGEWYTVAKDPTGFPKPNEGQKLSNVELGKGIAAASVGRKWSHSVADPSIFTEAGDRSIYERLVEGSIAYYSSNGDGATERSISFKPAKTERSAGWQRLLEMLIESGKHHPEAPGVWVIARNCPNWVRTFPVLPSDEKKPDDVDTKAEDHAADETRYAVMTKRSVTHSQELLM